MVNRVVGSVAAASVVAGCIGMQSGCTSNRAGPLRTSLTQLTSESRTFSGLALRQTEFVSLAGLIGVPAPGLIYHLSDESEQSSLFGVSYDTKSFLLIGESAPATEDYVHVVNMLKREIESYEARRAEFARDAGAYLASREALLKASDEAVPQKGGVDTVPASLAELRVRCDQLRRKLDEHADDLRSAAVKIS